MRNKIIARTNTREFVHSLITNNNMMTVGQKNLTERCTDKQQDRRIDREI